MSNRNALYPIFLKVSKLQILIVGGGNVSLEKLSFLLKSSPNAIVTVVAPHFISDLLILAKQHTVEIINATYSNSFLKKKNIVIAATDMESTNLKIYNDCKKKNILVNVADNPPLCDFYMGGIVTKGDLKLAISTNGKSPTITKRLRQFFEQILPDTIENLIKNLNSYRSNIEGDFEDKVERLDQLTKELIDKEN